MFETLITWFSQNLKYFFQLNSDFQSFIVILVFVLGCFIAIVIYLLFKIWLTNQSKALTSKESVIKDYEERYTILKEKVVSDNEVLENLSKQHKTQSNLLKIIAIQYSLYHTGLSLLQTLTAFALIYSMVDGEKHDSNNPKLVYIFRDIIRIKQEMAFDIKIRSSDLIDLSSNSELTNFINKMNINRLNKNVEEVIKMGNTLIKILDPIFAKV